MLPQFLHLAHLRADRPRCAELLTAIDRSGEMIGVRVRIEHPRHLKPLSARAIEDRIRAGGGGRAGLAVVIEHRIDDRRLAAGLVGEEVLQAARDRFVKRPDSGAREIVLGHMRSEEHTSELQSLMRISYAVFCLKKKKQKK